jgi:arginase
MMPRRRPLRAIVADAHPGGRYPGIDLPPVWFKGMEQAVRIESALPDPGDKPGVIEAVRQMCEAIRAAEERAAAEGAHPVLIGGDHSLAMGSIAASVRRHERLAVVWIDAHADFNTMATSPTGNPHGMPLSAACGLGDARLTGLFQRHVRPSDVVLIGARDIDPGEQELLDAHGVCQISVAQVRELGPEGLIGLIRERVGELPVHLSFDFDVISKEYFAATGTPVDGGLTPDEGAALLRALASSGLEVVASDWVEYDPRHETAEASGNIAQALFEAFHGKGA